MRCAIIIRSKDVDTKKVNKKIAAKLLQEEILNSAQCIYTVLEAIINVGLTIVKQSLQIL